MLRLTQHNELLTVNTEEARVADDICSETLTPSDSTPRTATDFIAASPISASSLCEAASRQRDTNTDASRVLAKRKACLSKA